MGEPVMTRLTLRLKTFLKKISAVGLILLIVLSPFFLIIDFVSYSPLVLTVWLLSAAYYVFVKSRDRDDG